MRIRYLKFGLISILLASAMMLSMISVLPFVSAGSVDYTPSDTTIVVQQGQVFLVRNTITFNLSQGGVFSLAILWDSASSDDNYTLDNAPSAYWTAMLAGNPHSVGDNVENVQFDNIATLDGWSVGAFIDSTDKNYYNGTFNVDFWLRAASPDGTPHRLGLENNLSYGGGIYINEGSPQIASEDNIAVRVVSRGVDVSISPNNQSGAPGTTLNYTVTIKNTGNLGNDNYSLTVVDNASWTPTLDNYLFTNVPENVSFTTTLHVHVPSNAIGDTNDNVIVKATSQGDNTKSDNASCTAHATIVRGVQVLITPPSQENENGKTLVYTVTVKNTGNVQENFQLTKGDNAGWSLSLDNTWLLVPNSENRATKLTVNIPSGAVPGARDNVWVRAASQDNAAVFDNESCLARVLAIRGVQVVITPSPPAYLENENGKTLVYTVTVTNTGNVQDNYALTRGDNAGWGLENLVLDNYWLVVPTGENRTTKLTVTIPSNAAGGTFDNIWVRATSNDNSAVFDNKSCLAHVMIVRGVDISISPRYQGAIHGAIISYTVTVKNIGNIQENYTLTKSDNENWDDNVMLDNSWLVVPPGKEGSTALGVMVPNYAAPGTHDNLMITATSKDDNSIKDNDSCLALAVPCTGTASVRLAISENPPYLWGTCKVKVTVNLQVYDGDNLNLRFLGWDNKTVEWENVMWSRTSPGVENVSFSGLLVPHDNSLTWPAGGSPSINLAKPANTIKRVELVLTDGSGAVILDNMAWYTVVQDDWSNRINWIILHWGSHTSPQQDQLSNEISAIIIGWASVPTVSNQHDFSA